MSLRLRIILLAAACILPAILLLAETEWQLRQARAAEVQQEMSGLARSEAGELETIIGGARQFLTALQRAPAIQERNQPLCSAWLARLRSDFPGYDSIRSDDMIGRLICSSTPGQAGFDGDAPYFQAALHGFVVGPYSLSPSGNPELPLAQRITDDFGQPVGVLVVGVDLNWLAQNLRARLPADASLAVLDRSGAVLLRVSAAAMPHQPIAAGTPRDLIESHVTLGNGLQVITARPRQSMFVVLDRATLEGAVLIGLALLAACIVAALLGWHFISTPVKRLLAVQDQLRNGNLSARSGMVAGRSELAQLGAGLDALAMELEHRQRGQADAERRLRQLAGTLEERVAERTRALAEANQRLVAEAQQRQQAQTELAQVQKLDALGKLTGGIAHDFNNLLAAVLGALEMASPQVEAPRVKRLLGVAEQAARRGAGLTKHLLAFSRKQELALRPTGVNDIISGMRDLLARTLGTLVQVNYDLAADAWAAITDPVQLEVALLNLAINARDAMPEGGTLSFRTRNVQMREGPHSGTTLPAGDYVMVAVIDTGEGMTPDVLAKVFEPFFTTKGPDKGTGLGLSMVYGFARQAGGAVTLDSVPGKGTAVSLYLPRATEAARDEVHRPDDAGAMPQLSVLLVDDDALVREITAETLRELGHRVAEAADGATALEFVRQPDAYDVVVADLGMPGMTGEQLAVRLKEVRRWLPVLLLTGDTDSDVLNAWRERGGRVLQKPFTRGELIDALRDSLRTSDLA